MYVPYPSTYDIILINSVMHDLNPQVLKSFGLNKQQYQVQQYACFYSSIYSRRGVINSCVLCVVFVSMIHTLQIVY